MDVRARHAVVGQKKCDMRVPRALTALQETETAASDAIRIHDGGVEITSTVAPS